ncbi:MAG: UvrD-helicase domain-containing protein [Candidatus Omnitrophica bacterium]|nr:UvrD-helicase domain-containing protein [Candidatus Omnitrophota bacterium]MDD5592343.1 UvrD-helicase domain-containing protein [Candidatus Omnitrophota bacterium]
MNSILEGLNKEQLDAVTHRQGPLLIIAGAGTGKTTVITRRIAWLLSEGLCKTDEILALTFTDKAARQMLERVDTLVPYGYTDIWISTFHAFGDRLLRENALVTGINPDFKVLTRPEAAVFFREHLFEFILDYYRPLSDPTRFIEALISLFNRAKDEDISPEEYFNFAQDLMLKAKLKATDPIKQEEALAQIELAHAYAKYQELLRQEGLVDFGNQFYMALQLLRAHPLVLNKYQQQFKYILVDEFQDTNFAQFQIINLLAQANKNIAVVADDDQCIYRWRGAAYSNVLNFTQTFPEAKKVSLIQNYRSGQAILDSAYRLIQNNNPERFEIKANINKKLVAVIGSGEPPQHKHFDTNSSETDWVAATIKEKVKAGHYKYKDFAILVRSNSDAQAYLQALNMQDIPWQFSGNQGLYSRQEVKLCISFLRVISNHSDSLQLYYLASCEIYNLNLADLTLCMHYTRRRNKSLYSAFKDLDNITELSEISPDSREKIKKLMDDLHKFMEASRNQTTGRLLYSFLTETGYLKKLTREQSLENETKIQNLARFFNIVRDFELVAREDRVINFTRYLNLLIDAGDDPPTVEADLDSDAVNVLTIHKAKGLEFRIVFLVSLVNGRFPVPRRRQSIELPDSLIKEILPSGDFHIQEERRLFYVGMTRAKEALYLTSASDYGGERTRRISQFVVEVLGKEVLEKEKIKTHPAQAIERFAPSKESKKAHKEKIPQDQLINLSYYQVDDYLTCPLKYKYVNILRVPIMEHHTVIYGRAMHEAVCNFFQYKISGRDMGLDELLCVFKNSFQPQGFLDEKHQQERLRIGKEALARFYKAEKTRNSKPAYIEKSFSFILENNKIAGRFDRVDMEEGKAVIIDFKTSEITKQAEADKRTKESLQLDLYALAYKNINGELPKRVELHFLESGLIGAKAVNEETPEKIIEKIREVSEGIRKQDFSATPAYMACTYCAYNQVCPRAMIR